MKKLFLLKSMLLLFALVVGSTGMWAANYVINTSNFTKTGSGSGYAAYDGDHTIGGFTITSSNVMIQSSKIQFKSTPGYLYNKTAMPGSITKITLDTGSNLKIYVGTSANSETTEVTSGSTITGNNTYFKVKSNGSTGTAVSITVQYSSTYTVTYDANGADEGTAPTDGTKYAENATVTVLGNTGSLERAHYSFGGWNTKADGSGTTYAGGATFSITDNTTLYAKWNGNIHDIISMPATDAYGSYAASETDDIPYGTEVTLTYIPASGYESYVATWFVNGAKISGNSFNMIDDDVTITVTVALPPDYAELPFAWNGGKDDLVTGMTFSGTGTDYSTSNTKLKFNDTGVNLVLKINDVPGKLTFSIKGNTFSGGTFKVQESDDGSAYSDVDSYTSLGDEESKTITTLKSTTRYIKWLYSDKKTGNVGLGNIKLNLGISDAADYTPTAMNGVDVTMMRSFVAGWNGIVLPFDLTNAVKTTLGATEVKTLGSATESAGVVTLNFTDAVLPVAAGTPVLVKLSAAKTNVSFDDVDIKTTTPTTVAKTVDGNTFTLTGTYSSTDLTASEVYLVSNDKFYHKKATVALTAKPFRAYIVQTASGGAHLMDVNFDLEGGEATAIVEVKGNRVEGRNECFNLAGQRVQNPTKGLYIVNGKKYIVK